MKSTILFFTILTITLSCHQKNGHHQQKYGLLGKKGPKFRDYHHNEHYHIHYYGGNVVESNQINSLPRDAEITLPKVKISPQGTKSQVSSVREPISQPKGPQIGSYGTQLGSYREQIRSRPRNNDYPNHQFFSGSSDISSVVVVQAKEPPKQSVYPQPPQKLYGESSNSAPLTLVDVPFTVDIIRG